MQHFHLVTLSGLTLTWGSFHVKSIKKSTNPLSFRSNLISTLPLASKRHTPTFNPLWPPRSEMGSSLVTGFGLIFYLQMSIALVLTKIEGCGFRQKQDSHAFYQDRTTFCSWPLNDLWPFKVKCQKNKISPLSAPAKLQMVGWRKVL